MSKCIVLAGCLCVLLTGAAAHGLVIDDFTSGPLAISKTGPYGDGRIIENQSGLDADRVISGSRYLYLDTAGGDLAIPATLTIDPDAPDGRFRLRSGTAWSYFTLRYPAADQPPLGLDATQHGNALMLHNVRYDLSAYYTAPLALTVSGRSVYLPLIDSGDPTDLIIPFSRFGIGLTSVSAISIGGIRLPQDFSFALDGISIVHEPPLPGDANRDRRVDGEDLLIWQAHFGADSGATFSMGDFNGDGRVDGEDFLVWQAHFGSTASSPASGGVAEGSAAVPEPAAGGLLLVLAGGLALRRR